MQALAQSDSGHARRLVNRGKLGERMLVKAGDNEGQTHRARQSFAGSARDDGRQTDARRRCAPRRRFDRDGLARDQYAEEGC
jgi:hypothetical protein